MRICASAQPKLKKLTQPFLTKVLFYLISNNWQEYFKKKAIKSQIDLNFSTFSLQNFLMSLKYVLKKLRGRDDFFSFVYFFTSLTMFILKIKVDLLTLKFIIMVKTFSFSLNFWKIFPCWYAIHIIFFVSFRLFRRIL